MDAAVNQVMEHALLEAAQKIEDNLDEQIHKMDNLDEDDLEKLRQEKLKVCSWISVISYVQLQLDTHTHVCSKCNAVEKKGSNGSNKVMGNTATSKPRRSFLHL